MNDEVQGTYEVNTDRAAMPEWVQLPEGVRAILILVSTEGEVEMRSHGLLPMEVFTLMDESTKAVINSITAGLTTD